MSNAQYVFVFSGSDDWHLAPSDAWDIDLIELDGSEKVMGHRQIDGVICKIVKTADGKLVAISKHK